MNILIIGANGFIGKHLCEYFTKNSTYTLLTLSSKELKVLM
ncbi:MAG: NAD-dependent epimerase/dehydratase family protein [Sulfuricurvum sp.]|jgi:nucleoside-diphosphate-sugar epimerase|nr:NAD-dependent epimerase/dehydratase family protein [Sulfuricurvum sp.]MCK9373414.1 NAD-dependent epimerase/dehydratase family protein [Sulfuricurvum sp.]